MTADLRLNITGECDAPACGGKALYTVVIVDEMTGFLCARCYEELRMAVAMDAAEPESRMRLRP